MKKLILALFLTLAPCVASVATFNAHASEAPKKLERMSEYVEHLKENYDVLVVEDRSLYPDENAASVEAWAGQLSPILEACETLGADFTKTLAAEDPTGYIEIRYASGEEPGPYSSTGLWLANPKGDTGDYGFMITGEGTFNTVIPPHVIVHEMAHCLDISTGMANSGVAAIDGLGYQTEEGAKVAGAYISERAKHSAPENYAESLAWGVLNGPRNPCPYGKDSHAYKSCEAVFDDLVEFAGYESRATQRMAAYLGIDISKELAG
jgi:hypothetical protein